jgi:hypothetical protein
MQALSQLSYTPDEAANYIERLRIVQVKAARKPYVLSSNSLP